jgi:biotin carboxylase
VEFCSLSLNMEVSSLKTIVFIGTNKSGSSREAIKAAEKLGYVTVLFTNNGKQMHQREEYTDVHEMIFVDTEDLSAMKEEIHKLQFQGKEIRTIISFINSYVYTASLLCDEFCKNYFSSETIYKMENKIETRLALKDQPFTPTFYTIDPADIDFFHTAIPTPSFPVMVKSPNSTGSKDALLAENEELLQKHINRLAEKYPKEPIIIEEYIDGDQYLVEALVHQGKILIAAIIKQEITQGKRFIITGYGVLTHVPEEIQVGIETVLSSIVTQLGIENGPLHLEMRCSKDGWKLIEINPRISGGAMNKMIDVAFGYNLVEETLKLSLGENPSLNRQRNHFVFTQYIIVSNKGMLERVTGKTRAQKSPGVIDVYIKPRKGTLLTPPLSMGHRYAYVMASGTTLDHAKHLAKIAAQEITFHLVDGKNNVENT